MITGIVVSPDSKMFATMEEECSVSLFKMCHDQEDTRNPMQWNFSGKRRTHEIDITAISFGESLDEKDEEEMKLRLFSVGRDRRLFEYDVYRSDQEGLIVANMFKIE